MLLFINKIRDHYNYLTPIILEASNKNIVSWADPYCDIDWIRLMSPIEIQTWQAIRHFGKAPLYPQYPINNKFIDFANPFIKVGIECDGKEFHKDKEKDIQRDSLLLEDGWVIYRISGSDCTRPVSEDYYNIEDFSFEEQESLIKDFYEKTIDGLIKAIGIIHFRHREYCRKPNEIHYARECLRMRGLSNHIDVKRGDRRK